MPDLQTRPPGEYAAYRARLIGPRFFFDAAVSGLPWTTREPAPEDLTREADEIIDGRFRVFGGPAVELGFPPDWRGVPPPLAARPRLASDRPWAQTPPDRE